MLGCCGSGLLYPLRDHLRLLTLLVKKTRAFIGANKPIMLLLFAFEKSLAWSLLIKKFRLNKTDLERNTGVTNARAEGAHLSLWAWHRWWGLELVSWEVLWPCSCAKKEWFDDFCAKKHVFSKASKQCSRHSQGLRSLHKVLTRMRWERRC